MMVRLIIFGPPGAGKGTYSAKLEKILGITKISTGDVLREEVKRRTELGVKIEKYLEKGVLVPDDIVIEIVKREILRASPRGFILDGFPRNLYQAKALEKITTIDAIINLLIPEEILIEKLLGRRICSRCGEIYNVANIDRIIDGIRYLLPPLTPQREGVCDKCGGPLIMREDDKVEVIKRRLRVYKEYSEPIIEYYRSKGLEFIDILVNREPEVIVRRIVNALKSRGLLT